MASKDTTQRKLTRKQEAFVLTYLACWNATEAARQAGYAFPNVEGPKNLVNPSIVARIQERLTELKMDADEVLERLAAHARGSLADVVTFRAVRRQTTVVKPVAEVIADLHVQIAFETEYAERVGLNEEEQKTFQAQLSSIRRRIVRLELRLERDPAATEEAPGPVVKEQVAEVDLAKAERLGKLHLVKAYNAKDNRVELYDAQAALGLLGKHHGLFVDKHEVTGKDGGPVVVQVLRGVSMDDL